MAPLQGGNRPIVMFGLSAAFVVLVILNWRAVGLNADLIVYLDTLNTKVASVNATLDQLKSDMHGAGGCGQQLKAMQDERAKYQSVDAKEKTLIDKTATVTKLEADVKKLTDEKAVLTTSSAAEKSRADTCKADCDARISKAKADCSLSTAAPARGLLGRLFH